jgi:hypothetical protein
VADVKVWVPTLEDLQVLDLFKELADWIPQATCNVNTGLASGNPLSPEDKVIDAVRELKSSIIQSVTVSHPKDFHVRYYRGGTQEPKSHVLDEFHINDNNSSRLEPELKLKIHARVAALRGAADQLPTSHFSPDQQELVKAHHVTLNRLESLNAELIRGSEAFRQKLEKDFAAKAQELDGRFLTRQEALQAASDEESRKLKAQEDDLAARLRAIDDRANTHARREIRKDIIAEVKQRSQEFSLTSGTNRLRWPIHAACITLAGVSFTAAIFFARELSALLTSDFKTSALAYLGIKQLAASIAFAASMVFYIRWMNSWFSQHATTEFKLRQFQLDIERASWAVETALEWKDSKGGLLQGELVEAITRGLFSGENAHRDPVHPADELASALMGTASRVKLRAGDSELELEPKLLKRAQGKADEL